MDVREMDKYIDREAALREIERREALMVGDKRVSVAAMKSFIKNRPSADVAPVVHGRWEDSIDEWFGTDVYTCSECRESYVLVEGTPKENLWHYCPNCGAKMDGGAD